MKLDQLDVFHVSYPLKNPWRTAYGKDTAIHSILVRSVSGDYYSWSESTPFFAPHYMSESAGSVFYHITEIFGPNLVGGEFVTMVCSHALFKSYDMRVEERKRLVIGA